MKILLPLVFRLIVCSVNGQSLVRDDFKGFSRSDFTISYPSDWRVDTSGTMNTKVFFFSPLEGPEDKFSDNLNVMIQNLAGHQIDIQKYKEISEQQIKAMFSDGKLLESKVMNSNGREEYRLSYEFSQGTFKLKVLAVCFIKNDMAYLATFTSEVSKFEGYRETAEKMLGALSMK
ncbi:MAG: hypothetical protein J7619_10095 [Dyadobacter sp.]|uniref:PsbP-related protein n=1 Tax=Dyadobacter sp. TaxID=1914288 RepID=UPI001B20D89D|nr:PsbP-related protein [Dyadobacter sp.]MBO9613036.1 hypothetical protein [Dyadobacter sp.]